MIKCLKATFFSTSQPAPSYLWFSWRRQCVPLTSLVSERLAEGARLLIQWLLVARGLFSRCYFIVLLWKTTVCHGSLLRLPLSAIAPHDTEAARTIISVPCSLHMLDWLCHQEYLPSFAIVSLLPSPYGGQNCTRVVFVQAGNGWSPFTCSLFEQEPSLLPASHWRGRSLSLWWLSSEDDNCLILCSLSVTGGTLAITGTYLLVTFAPHSSVHITAHLVQYYMFCWQFLLYLVSIGRKDPFAPPPDECDIFPVHPTVVLLLFPTFNLLLSHNS